MELIVSSSVSDLASERSLPSGEYEVFLSFRGPDIRTTFADHLYQFLDNYGIHTFLDSEELRKGEKIAPELVKAIAESKIYIPIFSPNYASSKWCLGEVALMLKYYKQEKGHTILPVFYFMEPNDVRHQKGCYEEAFQLHGEKHREETVKEWKEALEEVGQIKGWVVNQSQRQGAVVREIFSHVRSHLMGSYLLVTEKLVRIESAVEDMINLLNKGVKVVGIVGMGGIGKTTIAMAVRDKIYTKFDCCCFLRDVHETLLGKGIVSLQKQIISAIVGHDEDIQDASQGMRIIKDIVRKHKVLIIIDDPGERFEIQNILGKVEDISAASRLIITTRNKRVLESFQHELYIPEELDHDHSLQLFSRHAFGLDYPPTDRVALSKEFVKVAAGLPLALKVIGSTLNRKSEKFWIEKLKQLEKIPQYEVLQRLMISYLDLSREEQHIFLDIACFFIGQHKRQPFYMWNDCDFYPEIGVDTLIIKSLIKVNERNEFWMHDSVRDMGRAIVHEEDSQCPWKRSRIWSKEDALDMLINSEGSDQLKGLRVQIEDNCLKITDRQFEKLSTLRYLEIVGGGMTGNFIGILPNIRWLGLHDCSSIPIDLNTNKLVVFSISHCPVKDEWRGWKKIKVAHKLKSLCLYACSDIRRAPDLSQCGDLELLNLGYCLEMSGELHIGYLKNLQLLDLTLTKITKLVGEIGMLQNLHEITAVDSKLGELPAGIDRLSSLEILRLKSYQSELKEVPALPSGLKRLSLTSPRVPNLLDLTNLEKLWISHCDGHEIPKDIQKLSKLKSMKFWNLKSWSIPDKEEEAGNRTSSLLPSSLNRLDIRHCHFLERQPNFANLVCLTKLILSGICVREIRSLGELRMLKTFEISDAPNLITLDGLQHLILLKALKVVSCSVLEQLPSLLNLIELQELEISCCELLSEFDGLGELGESLLCLKITCFPSSVYTEVLGSVQKSATMEPLFPFLSKFGKLRKLVLILNEMCGDGILSQAQFLDFSGLQDLQELFISRCERLTEVNGLEGLSSLGSLHISYCSAIRKLPCLSGCKLLWELDIMRCTLLTEIVGLECLDSVRTISLSGCTSIKKLPDLSCLKHLESLDVSGCTQLTEVTGLENLQDLSMLKVDESLKIPSLESSVIIIRE